MTVSFNIGWWLLPIAVFWFAGIVTAFIRNVDSEFIFILFAAIFVITLACLFTRFLP